jgi:hypothetical protein
VIHFKGRISDQNENEHLRKQNLLRIFGTNFQTFEESPVLLDVDSIERINEAELVAHEWHDGRYLNDHSDLKRKTVSAKWYRSSKIKKLYRHQLVDDELNRQPNHFRPSERNEH